MTHTAQTSPLSYSDRCIIASVITWDNMGNPFSPNDIWAICIEHDMVWVKLTKKRSYPISKFMFRSILQQQRFSATCLVEKIEKTEITSRTDWLFETAQNAYHDPNWTDEGCEF